MCRVNYQCSDGRYIRMPDVHNGRKYWHQCYTKTKLMVSYPAHQDWSRSHNPFYYSNRTVSCPKYIYDRTKVYIIGWCLQFPDVETGRLQTLVSGRATCPLHTLQVSAAGTFPTWNGSLPHSRGNALNNWTRDYILKHAKNALEL